METFETTFENLRQEPVIVYGGPHPLLVLYPGRSRTVESASPFALYARWVRVAFLHDDAVELILRAGFNEPDRGRWTIEALNIEGQDVEHRTIGGLTFWLPRNIPVIVPVDPGSPEAVYSTLRIERAEEWAEVPGFKGYLYKMSKPIDVWIKRNAEDLAGLARLQGEPSGGPCNRDLFGK
jgi:hypothetical protein